MSKSEEGLFHEVLQDLGHDPQDLEQGENHILVYREPPSENRTCHHCKENVHTGESLEQGEEYVLHRVNEEGSPFPLREKTFHVDCWEEYRE